MSARSVAAALAAAAGMACLAAPASATTLEGRCQIDGSVKFGSPVTFMLADNDFTFDGTAVCTGTLDGKPITNREGTLKLRKHAGSFSCAGSGEGDAPGQMVFVEGRPDIEAERPLDDPRDKALDVTVSEFSFGEYGPTDLVDENVQGFGAGLGRVSYGSPDQLAAACLGAGFRKARFTADVPTVFPLVSESEAPYVPPAPDGTS